MEWVRSKGIGVRVRVRVCVSQISLCSLSLARLELILSPSPKVWTAVLHHHCQRQVVPQRALHGLSDVTR